MKNPYKILEKLNKKSAIIFCIAATLPYLIFSGFNFSAMRMIQLVMFIFLPMICGFIAGGILGKHIKYRPFVFSSGLLHSLGLSFLIMLFSVIIWSVLTSLIIGLDSFYFAFLAVTVLSVLTYPAAFLAGTVLWWTERQKHSHLLVQADLK